MRTTCGGLAGSPRRVADKVDSNGKTGKGPELPAGSGTDLLRRFKTALAVGPPILLSIYLGVWPFTAVVILLGALIFIEWDRLSRKIEADAATWVGVAGVALAGIAAAMGQVAFGLAATGLAFLVMCVLRPKARNRAWMGFGLIYAAAPVISLIVLAAAAFAAFNLVNRMVEAQRREIGIGMALGEKSSRLAI